MQAEVAEQYQVALPPMSAVPMAAGGSPTGAGTAARPAIPANGGSVADWDGDAAAEASGAPARPGASREADSGAGRGAATSSAMTMAMRTAVEAHV